MKRGSSSPRAGVVLICVLVCLGVASAIVLGSVRSSLRARRQMQTEIQLEQTRWLLEAGVIRGVQKLRADGDYTGETWQVDEAIAKFDRARVEITVSREDASAETARLNVVAEVSRNTPHAKPTRRSENLVIPPTRDF